MKKKYKGIQIEIVTDVTVNLLTVSDMDNEKSINDWLEFEGGH